MISIEIVSQTIAYLFMASIIWLCFAVPVIFEILSRDSTLRYTGNQYQVFKK